jgi:hypothetical protein
MLSDEGIVCGNWFMCASGMSGVKLSVSVKPRASPLKLEVADYIAEESDFHTSIHE